ncbi:hypothetical protein [Kocuria sp. U4B]
MSHITAAHLSQHLAKTRRVLEATGTECQPLDAIAASWARYQDTNRVIAPLVAEAVLRDSQDLQTLHALALAAESAGHVEDASVRNAVADIIHTEAHQAYKQVATEVWEAAAAMFNASATRFTKATTIVNPEAPAEAVVRMDNKTRTAWMDAVNAAAELDQLTPLILDAAALAGWATGGQERQLPLVCKPGEAHRRRVWEAWVTTDGNTRRWGALNALGVTIAAPEDLDDVKPYREPKPLEIRQVRSGVGIRQIQVDPEDACLLAG